MRSIPPSALLFVGCLAVGSREDDLFARARLALAEGQADRVLADLEAALSRGAEDERGLRLLLGETLLAAGRADQALQVLDPLPGGDDWEAMLWFGRALRQRGQQSERDGAPREDVEFSLGEALAWLEKAAAASPPDEERAALDGGYLALSAFDDPARARRLADALLERRPESGEARLLRGCAGGLAYAHAKSQREIRPAAVVWQDALDDFLTAGELLGPERGEPFWQLVWLYEDRGHGGPAVEAAIQHRDRTKGADLSTLWRLARRYAREDAWVPAQDALLAMVARDADELVRRLRDDPDPTTMASTLGGAVLPLLEAGDLRRALPVLRALLAADPAEAGLWNNFALACRDRGTELEEAGQAEEARRHYEESYAAYEKALALDERDPRLLNDTALVLQYHLHRDLERARSLYEKALAIADEELAKTPPSSRAEELARARADAASNLAKLDGP